MTTAPNASPTLDGLFRRSLARQPDALALVDPADKMRITLTPPQRLTFAQADRIISKLTAHFFEAGLPANSVIAVQLPNTVEFVLTMLAAHRAGLVVAVLPQLWRQADLTTALNRTGARAIVTSSRIDGISHADLVMHAAAEAFSIRYVGGFGDGLPEGMTPLDDVLAGDRLDPIPVTQDARRAAMISFDVTADGFRVIPRTHLNLISGGLAIFLESGLPQGATMLSAMLPTSFAGVAASLVTWLLSGGVLALHHPFDGQVLEHAIGDLGCDVLVAPAPLAQRLADGGLLDRSPTLRHVVGIWRAPEQVAASAVWPAAQADFTDVYLFGEAGLFGAIRGDDGLPQVIMPGPYGAPRTVAGAAIAGDVLLTPRGTLGLRGPMVPVMAYTAQADASNGLIAAKPADYVDTGYVARLDRATGAVHITAPPSGIMAVGGYRFLAQDLGEWARRLGDNTMLTALPDRLSGYRLAGRASDNARARDALTELGLNPLMVEAFRDRVTSE
ncbi:MAG: class I adenylate-forming enzyme family protein [Tardiphaga sp.]